MRTVDLFCGCGGISYGFHLAGFDIIGGVSADEKDVDKRYEELTMKNGYTCLIFILSTVIFWEQEGRTP